MTDDEFIAQLSQHERLLHSISVTFAHGDAEAEKDIYQEILYNLWRTRDRYNGQCSVKNWFYRVGLNTAISLWRQEKKRVKTTPITPLMEDTVADEPSNPLYNELYQLIDLLSKDDQALVFLYIDGATEEEMASVLGISQSNVGVRIHRVKQKLSKLKS
jgi:RNA polymerase sigma-70 factor (ECF subfamily)